MFSPRTLDSLNSTLLKKSPLCQALSEARPRERGFALLLVLWSIGLLALVATWLMAGGRVEGEIANNLRSAAHAEAAADGAIQETIFGLLGAAARARIASSDLRRVLIPGGAVSVLTENEDGKVNLNVASPVLLAALLRAIGVDAPTAAEIAASIAAWRESQSKPAYRDNGRHYGPAVKPFHSLDELGLVHGITPELLARLTPHLTIHNNGDIFLAAADPVVLRAALDASKIDSQTVEIVNADFAAVLSITAEARMVNGAMFVRRAVVRFALSRRGHPFQVLEWGEPAARWPARERTY